MECFEWTVVNMSVAESPADVTIASYPPDGHRQSQLTNGGERKRERMSLKLKDAARLDLFGEEGRDGRLDLSLDHTLLRPGLVLHFRRFGGRYLASDFHLALDFLLRLFLFGHVDFAAVNRRLERIRRNSATIRIDVHLGPVRFARLPAARRLPFLRLAGNHGRHLVRLVRLFPILLTTN